MIHSLCACIFGESGFLLREPGLIIAVRNPIRTEVPTHSKFELAIFKIVSYLFRRLSDRDVSIDIKPGGDCGDEHMGSGT